MDDLIYREAVNLLLDSGAAGAIVLAGVDGLLGGRRRRARSFRNASAPMVTVSVGPPEPLRRSLVQLAELLPRPAVTLERIAQVNTTANCWTLLRARRALFGVAVAQTNGGVCNSQSRLGEILADVLNAAVSGDSTTSLDRFDLPRERAVLTSLHRNRGWPRFVQQPPA